MGSAQGWVYRIFTIGERPKEQPAYPAELLYCPHCHLVQLGLIVDPSRLFPPEYPYTSGTTRILRENFAQLYEETQTLVPLNARDLVVDVGSNDGTLLSNFKEGGHRVQGIEPSQVGNLAIEQGIPTTITFFGTEIAQKVRREQGPATLVTATNVFAHIQSIHEILDSILVMLAEGGIFISESHYVEGLIETLQYDTVYHEHLRYYSLRSLEYLLNLHGLEVIEARRIPTHGGSIRVYAARKGKFPVGDSVHAIRDLETPVQQYRERLADFSRRTTVNKLELNRLLLDIKRKRQRIYGIGAPSRASTLINFVGLDNAILDSVLEISGSYKIGKYIPGTLIPVLEETRLFDDPPDFALMLSWHIADEIVPKLREKGFKGGCIVPLPEPRIIP